MSDYTRSGDEPSSVIWVLSVGALLFFLVLVYQRTLTGQAELKQATWNRQIKVQEAEAAQESAKHLAQAEIERAKGVAEANRIIGNSLKGNEDYLRYLWIHNLAEAEGKGAEVIYIPTEANLPILEAVRKLPKPAPAEK
jgi:regulator of protease activity HflC (stomatin/prohibitin superfamily)